MTNGSTNSLYLFLPKFPQPTYQYNRCAFQLGPGYSKRDVIAPGGRQPQPGRQFQQLRQHVLVQLQVGELTFAPECAQVHLIG